jgi:hypothetical protein
MSVDGSSVHERPSFRVAFLSTVQTILLGVILVRGFEQHQYQLEIFLS